MKRLIAPSTVLTTSLLLLASSSFSHIQAAALATNATIGASNTREANIPINSGAMQYSETGQAVSASASETFHGMDSNGFAASMEYSGTAKAVAAYGKLHTAASASVKNVYYNEDNDPYFDDDSEFIDIDGSPTLLVTSAYAQFSDTLNYGNVPAGFTTNFYFHITGSFTGSNVSHFIMIFFGDETDHVSITPSDGGMINQTWVSKKFSPTSGVDIGVRTYVSSEFELDTQLEQEGADYEGKADFYNTVTLAGVNVYDPDDNLVGGWTLSSESGTTYPIPEPSVVLLGGLGVLGLLRRRR